MPPDLVGNLVILDLEWEDSEVVCIVQRYDPIEWSAPKGAHEPLRVSWNATNCPPGYVPVAEGAVYVLRPPGFKASDYPGQPSKLNARLSWRDTMSADGLMLVIVLPKGYVLPSVDDADPTLGEAKAFKNRMAIYWVVMPQNGDRQQEFSWLIEKVQYTTAELKTRCSSLNYEAAERRRQANVHLQQPVLLTNPGSERQTTNSLLALITHWTFIVGLLIAVIGLILTLVGSSGNTNFTLFGQSFTSTNIGIAAIFVGVVMIIINIGRVLRVASRASQP